MRILSPRSFPSLTSPGFLLARIRAFAQLAVTKTIAESSRPLAGEVRSIDRIVCCQHTLISSMLEISLFSFSSVSAQNALAGDLTGQVFKSDCDLRYPV